MNPFSMNLPDNYIRSLVSYKKLTDSIQLSSLYRVLDNVHFNFLVIGGLPFDVFRRSRDARKVSDDDMLILEIEFDMVRNAYENREYSIIESSGVSQLSVDKGSIDKESDESQLSVDKESDDKGSDESQLSVDKTPANDKKPANDDDSDEEDFEDGWFHEESIEEGSQGYGNGDYNGYFNDYFNELFGGSEDGSVLEGNESHSPRVPFQISDKPTDGMDGTVGFEDTTHGMKISSVFSGINKEAQRRKSRRSVRGIMLN